jgi:hypothetical protein
LGLFSSEATRRVPEGEQMVGALETHFPEFKWIIYDISRILSTFIILISFIFFLQKNLVRQLPHCLKGSYATAFFQEKTSSCSENNLMGYKNKMLAHLSSSKYSSS